MLPKRSKLYIKAEQEKNEVICSGINFTEFVSYANPKIENMLVWRGDCNIELVEGNDNINRLAADDIYSYGDFSFIDYVKSDKLSHSNLIEISEQLSSEFTFQQMSRDSYDTLQSRFAYRTHDDGWFSKIYCRNLSEFFEILNEKIGSTIKARYNRTVSIPQQKEQEKLVQIASRGILIDLDELGTTDGRIRVVIYVIGAYTDMDEILNNFEDLKSDCSEKYNLDSNEEQWILSER